MNATIAQIRAGRALLGWSQQKLSQRAGMSRFVASRLEGGHGIADYQMIRLEQALNAAGVRFVPNGVVQEARS